MKLKTFRIILSRGWRDVMYSVSLFVLSMLSANAKAQAPSDSARLADILSEIVREDRFQGMRARAYGTRFPERKEPLIVVDAEIIPNDSVNKQCLDSLMSGKLEGNKENIARLLGIKKKELLRITILKDEAAIEEWGQRGAKGVVEVTTKKGAFEEQRRYSKSNEFEWEAINDEIRRTRSRTELNRLPGEGLYIPSNNSTYYSIEDLYNNMILK